MRGTPCEPALLNTLSGIIPAHAGNTGDLTGWTVSKKDHPRTCGEHQIDELVAVPEIGSSPHMRGTLMCWLCSSSSAGIIPAHAGNTVTSPERVSASRDHPRTRGEHSAKTACCIIIAGSSPHMRGTRPSHLHRPQRLGIIPAHAGNTFCCFCCVCLFGDHPRTCGEHCMVMSRWR